MFAGLCPSSVDLLMIEWLSGYGFFTIKIIALVNSYGCMRQ